MTGVLGILNAYDHRNRGDRAIIEAQMAWLQRKMPGASFRVFSPAWQENAEAFGQDVSQPPPIGIDPTSGKVANVIVPIGTSIAAACGIPSPKRLPQAFSECDGYFLCGGGYLYSSTSPLISRQLWMHAGNAMLALQSGRPVMQFPQSWGPVGKPADRWICRRLADRLPVICSRGDASTRLLNEWGFGSKTIEVPDIVIAMADLRPDLICPSRGGNGILGIAPIDFSFAVKSNQAMLDLYLSRIEQVANRFLSDGGREITLFPQVQVTGSDEDLPVAKELARRLVKSGASVNLLESCSWHRYFEEISSVSVFLGSRMHSCIFALVSGVPTIGLSYQPKFEALFAQLGMSGRCFPITAFNPDEVSERLVNLAADPAAVSGVNHAVAGLSKKVLEGLDRCWERSGAHALETQP